MGELKEQYLPKEEILNGVVFVVNDYEEKKGSYGDEFVLSVTLEKPIGDKVEYAVSLWQTHIRNYLKNVVKTKIFGKQHFVNKKFSIKSVALTKPKKDGSTAYGFQDLVYLGDLAPVEDVR